MMKRRTKFTILSICMLIAYTVVSIIYTWYDKALPSELTVAWYSAWTVELALLFGIKIKSND